jgi:hypothetical protein
MKTYYYIANVWEKDEVDVTYANEFKTDRDIDAVNGDYDEYELCWLVEDMASDYLRNYDGWEIADSWQGEYRDFVVWDSDKYMIGTFQVLLEYSPSFSAWRK